MLGKTPNSLRWMACPSRILKRAAVSREAEGGESVSVARHFEDLGPRPTPLCADHKLDEHMPVGRVHQVALGIVSQRVSDEPPGTEQCLA
jgi:hypothetical protein